MYRNAAALCQLHHCAVTPHHFICPCPVGHISGCRRNPIQVQDAQCRLALCSYLYLGCATVTTKGGLGAWPLYDAHHLASDCVCLCFLFQFQAYLVTEKANFFGMDLADQQQALQVRAAGGCT